MKVLVVGLGSIARKHINALRQILVEDLEIFALRSKFIEKEEDEIINLFDKADLPNIKFDFAIISNPTALHNNTIRNLLPLGVPLFIEKPIFGALGNNSLIEEVLQKNIITYVACNLRFLESLIFAKDFLADKRINEVNVYCGSYLPQWRPESDYKAIYSTKQTLGGGVHLDLIHELDYLYWIFGKPISVNRTLSSRSSLQIETIDYANYLIGYDNFYANVVLNYFRADSVRTFEAVCDGATLHVDLLKNECCWRGELVFDSSNRISDTYLHQMKYFIDNIVRGKSTFNAVDEAYKVLELCLKEN